MKAPKITNHWIVIVLLLFTTILSSCEKGDTGSAGPQGPQGTEGTQGVQGIPGKDGSKFYSGTGAPAAGLGALTDMYLDTQGSLLYGPKTAAGWGAGINLKGLSGADGATGASGTAGSQIHSGSGAPPTATGVPGDYYLDQLTAFLYGPKLTSGWGLPLNLKGPQGEPGLTQVMGRTLRLENADWKWNSQYSVDYSSSSTLIRYSRYVDIAEPKITQEVLENGLVQMYITPSYYYDTATFTPMPLVIREPFAKYSINVRYNFFIGGIRLHYFFEAANGTASADVPTISTYVIPTVKIKYVIVPGTAIAAAKQINMKDYQMVKTVFGLED